MCVLSRFQLFVTPWTVACQAPLSMEFSTQEYWYRLPFPTPGDLPNPGLNLCLLHLLHWQADSLPLAPPGKKYHRAITWPKNPIRGTKSRSVEAVTVKKPLQHTTWMNLTNHCTKETRTNGYKLCNSIHTKVKDRQN